MPDRERVVTVLQKRFPGSTAAQIAAAANAIMGLGAEWREVVAFEQELLLHLPAECDHPDCLVARLRVGGEFRLLERIPPGPGEGTS
jgi:hypothetical protein